MVVEDEEVGGNGDIQHMKMQFIKHLLCNTDTSLYMLKNSPLKCYKSLYEVCKMGEWRKKG